MESQERHESALQIVVMTIDYENRECALLRSDGKEARFPMTNGPGGTVVSRVHVTPAFQGFVAVTRAGDSVVFETPTWTGMDQLMGRLVVYLDQNQWSAFDNGRRGNPKIAESERQAARQLADWVDQRRIVLPASAGHYLETSKRFDQSKRYHLGLTILEYSRGWQMRDPIQVRRYELLRAIRRSAGLNPGPPDPAVFSLNPNIVHASRSTSSYEPSHDLPAEMRFQIQALTSATALISTMLDPERVEPGNIDGWVTANQQFSDSLDGQDRDSQQKRKSVDTLLISDFRSDIAAQAQAAGITPGQLSQWILGDATQDISRMSSSGIFRELLYDRHINQRTIWKPNDLTDMVYLSCAAGYADVVICERHIASVMGQGVKRLSRGVQIYRRLSDAVGPIAALLSQKASTT